jgi:hypothetical protein
MWRRAQPSCLPEKSDTNRKRPVRAGWTLIALPQSRAERNAKRAALNDKVGEQVGGQSLSAKQRESERDHTQLGIAKE